MNILTAEGILVSWGLSPVDMTSTQRSIFHTPSSSQAIRIVPVSCCTLCPLLDGPFGHVNERAIWSGIIVVTLLNCTCKAPCPPFYVYRLRFRLCSGTTNLFFSGRTALRSNSCLLPNLLRQLLHSRSIFSDCSSFCHLVEPLGGPTAGIWLSDTSLSRLIVSGAWAASINLTHRIFFKGVASCTVGSRLVRTTVPCGSYLVGSFETAISSISSAALSTTVPSSSEVYLSLSGS